MKLYSLQTSLNPQYLIQGPTQTGNLIHIVTTQMTKLEQMDINLGNKGTVHPKTRDNDKDYSH